MESVCKVDLFTAQNLQFYAVNAEVDDRNISLEGIEAPDDFSDINAETGSSSNTDTFAKVLLPFEKEDSKKVRAMVQDNIKLRNNAENDYTVEIILVLALEPSNS